MRQLPELVIPKQWWLTSNMRLHWAEKARRTRNIRQYAALTWRGLEHTGGWPILITAKIQYPGTGRADPANAAPTLKACIDGGTDAGLWPDDDSTHVIGPLPIRETGKSPKGVYVIRFSLIDQHVNF